MRIRWVSKQLRKINNSVTQVKNMEIKLSFLTDVAYLSLNWQSGVSYNKNHKPLCMCFGEN